MARAKMVGLVLVMLLALVAGGVGLAGSAAQDATPATTSETAVEARMIDATGAEVGTVNLTEESDGIVTVMVMVDGLPAGEHGIHVHEVGTCDPAGASPFESAGEHFNPTGAAHGGPPNGALGNDVATPAMMAMTPMATAAPMMGHGGDLGNITIGDDGSGTLEIRSNRFTVSLSPTTLFDQDGSTLLIHEMADDLVTDPGGMSGGRIACAVLAPPATEAELAGTPGAAGTPAASIIAPTPNQVVGNAFTPERVEFSAATVAELEVPDGFEIAVLAQSLGNARMMAIGPDGTIYLTRPDSNDVLALRDADGNGEVAAEETRVVASELELVHGIAIRDGRLYLAGVKQVWVADLGDDGSLGEPEVLIDQLPDGGQHPRRTIDFGPDGMLYVTVGSTCNVCDEPNPEHATILRADPETGDRTIFATGLRNTLGFGWHPDTGELWGSDMGSDWRGDNQPPDELNRLAEGNNYGWPYCYADRQVDTYFSQEPVGATSDAYCALTESAVLAYEAHGAPIWMEFYTAGQFPEEYQGNAFVALRGSWNRYPASGYKVVQVRFEDGQPAAIEDFITGWLSDDGTRQFGRIAGLAVTSDGALLVSDDTNGVIYRVAYAE